MAYLKQRGILPILNYAAEDDVNHDAKNNSAELDMEVEACLNKNVGIFMRSITDSDNTSASRGFVGIKVSLRLYPCTFILLCCLIKGAKEISKMSIQQNLGRLKDTRR